MFLAIEGGDGTGKSTQARLLAEWLREGGYTVVACRDPGSTALGEAVRGILLHRHDLTIDRRSEMLLYMAARAQMVEEVIRPALARGEIVVADRFLLSNVVYQGHAGSLGADMVWSVGLVATGGLQPDLTIVLDLPAEVAVGRIAREFDRMELQGADFHARVFAGFRAEAERRAGCVLVDASPPVEELQKALQELVAKHGTLPNLREPGSGHNTP